jgi:hypothetical protein
VACHNARRQLSGDPLETASSSSCKNDLASPVKIPSEADRNRPDEPDHKFRVSAAVRNLDARSILFAVATKRCDPAV